MLSIDGLERFLQESVDQVALNMSADQLKRARAKLWRAVQQRPNQYVSTLLYHGLDLVDHAITVIEHEGIRGCRCESCLMAMTRSRVRLTSL